MNKLVIGLCGQDGSGKTTVASILHDRYSYETGKQASHLEVSDAIIVAVNSLIFQRNLQHDPLAQDPKLLTALAPFSSTPTLITRENKLDHRTLLIMAGEAGIRISPSYWMAQVGHLAVNSPEEFTTVGGIRFSEDNATLKMQCEQAKARLVTIKKLGNPSTNVVDSDANRAARMLQVDYVLPYQESMDDLKVAAENLFRTIRSNE